MQKSKLFKIKFAGATNTQGSRIIITDMFKGTGKKRVILSYDYQIGSVINQGLEYLASKGAKIVTFAETDNEYYISVEYPFSLS